LIHRRRSISLEAPSFGAVSMNNATFDWRIRAADIDVRLMMLAFEV
jgi:hypothetical protein